MSNIRIIVFFCVAIPVILFLPFWYFVAIAFLYTLLINAPYELLILSVLVDVQFGEMGSTVWYAYTLATLIVLGVSFLIKPYLRFYEHV